MFYVVILMLMCGLRDKQERKGSSFTVMFVCDVDKGSVVMVDFST